MKLIEADSYKQKLDLKAETNRDVKHLLVALAAGKVSADDWRGWICCNGARVRFNPSTRTFYYAAKTEDNKNKFLFEHLARTLCRFTGVSDKDASAVSIDGKFGKDLDIFMGGSTRYYVAKWKLTKAQHTRLANTYDSLPRHFHMLIKNINTITDEK